MLSRLRSLWRTSFTTPASSATSMTKWPSAVRWLVVRDAAARALVGAAAGLVCSFLAAALRHE